MKKQMQKMAAVLLTFTLLLGVLTPASSLAEEKKISVVTTIFPIYDWVRQIAGDSDKVELTMLLDSGADLHNFQPTAADILKVSTADLFIYVGGESDEWVEEVLETAINPQLVSISLVDAMGDAIKLEEEVEGMEPEDEDDEEEAEYDEHVWLSLRNAEALCVVIADALTALDPDSAADYQANLIAYTAALLSLDQAYAEAVSNAAYHTLLFGDRFPFRYLVDDYGLSYYAAFSGCSAESEASFATIVFLAQKVDELNLPAVLTIEQPKARIAETIVSATRDKNQKILAMDSMQSVTSEGVRSGVTYLAVMESNLSVLTEALNE